MSILDRTCNAEFGIFEGSLDEYRDAGGGFPLTSIERI
jgi:hypothetical protein